MTRWGAYVSQRLDDLKNGVGREDWEGHWPSPVAVLSARDYAAEVFPDDAPTPSVVPTGEGFVAFVWHKGGWTIEFEVDRESNATVFFYDRDGGTCCETVDLEDCRDRFRDLLSELGRDSRDAG
jgi:hypothetical protein